jgi:hypothetical protein
MRAYAAAIKQADPVQAKLQRTFAQQAGAYATGLVLSKERLRYLQELNVETGVQKAVLPFECVADMSLAQDAIKLPSSPSGLTRRPGKPKVRGTRPKTAMRENATWRVMHAVGKFQWESPPRY